MKMERMKAWLLCCGAPWREMNVHAQTPEARKAQDGSAGFYL
jgi:hypothetical protein